MDELGNNLRRLMGLHAVPATKGSSRIGLSAQALSELQHGKRQPSVSTLQRLANFFELPMDRLLNAPFEELLQKELADAERYRRVEAKLQVGTSDAQRSSG